MVNFDIINQECRGDKLTGTCKDYKAIKNEDLINYPKEEAKHVLSAAFRNKRDDLWVKGDLMIKHFKENFNLLFSREKCVRERKMCSREKKIFARILSIMRTQIT